jgi:hypothetical protein
MTLCVLLASMMLRALVPSGWMPSSDPSADGSFIVICSSSEMKTIFVDGNGTPVEKDRHTAAPDSCIFGNAIAFGLPDAQPPSTPLASVESAPVAKLTLRVGAPVELYRVRDPPVPA